MAPRLSYGTHVRHPDTGAMVFLPAGSVPPSWAASQLGVHLIPADDDTTAPAPAPAPEPEPPRPEPALSSPPSSAPTPEPADDEPAAPAVRDPHVPAPPPRQGRGSGAGAWRTWAAAAGIEIEPDASRDEVIDAAIADGVLADDQ